MTVESYTNSSLACSRQCLRKYHLRYEQRLSVEGESIEALAVGQLWHEAFAVANAGGDPFAAIREKAISPIWSERLCRLYQAHRWRWAAVNDEFTTISSEARFRFELPPTFHPGGLTIEGRKDEEVRMQDGRVGLIERKTTSDDISAGSAYWSRLRMDVQVGLYSMSTGRPFDFVIYDVVRKPGTQPRKLTKAETSRIRQEIDKIGRCSWYGESIDGPQGESALFEGRETVGMYGARLSANIGDGPDFYFARQLVPRTNSDMVALIDDVQKTIGILNTGLRPRNPDACSSFGRMCEFFGLCSNNTIPSPEAQPPAGFVRREALHPELA